MLVLFAWKSGKFGNFMMKNFLLSAESGKTRQMLSSTFSHYNVFHFLCNMAALYSFSNLLSLILPVEQFLAFYLSCGNHVFHIN
jgi:rhomboid-like protein